MKQYGIKSENLEPFRDFIKSTGLTYKDGKQIMQLFKEGLDIGWFEIDRDGKIKAAEVSADMIQTIRQMLGIKSPSRVAIQIMDYFMQGLSIGIDQGVSEVLSSLTDATDLMTNATKLGLQAMIDSLDDDTIQPTITPVFDGNLIQNGVSAMSRSIGNLAPSVQATANSFKGNSSNYNSRFDTLANAVYGTNSLINSFMRMVEEGELVNINVNAEADPNNIYELVVNTNRQKFKQTGKNPLSY